MTGIVVGVDGSTAAAHALTWAAREADLHGWPLRAVLAWDDLDQHHPSPSRRWDPDDRERHAAEALDAYVEHAFAPAPPPMMERRTVRDLPARALIDSSAHASLLVVGARGLGGFRELLLGSVSQHCAHHATCPVAIVRADTDTDTRVHRIVVGFDGSDNARHALDWAVAEARVRHASLTLVDAWHIPYVDGERHPPELTNPRFFEEAARASVATTLAGLDTSGLPGPIEPIFPVGGAASAILDVAKGAGLIVVGSRGHGGFAGLLLGSVSHHVAHHATCPVVIVPPAR